MKTNILKGISLDVLDKTIDMVNDCYLSVPYIIMSESTANAIAKECNATRYITYKDSKYASYRGCPIAICNRLEFGEVDIR